MAIVTEAEKEKAVKVEQKVEEAAAAAAEGEEKKKMEEAEKAAKVEQKIDENAAAAAEGEEKKKMEEPEKEAGADEAPVIEGITGSSNLVSDLADPDQNGLAQLKDKPALAAGFFELPPPPSPPADEAKAEEPAKTTDAAAEGAEPKTAEGEGEPEAEAPAADELKTDAPAPAAAAAEVPMPAAVESEGIEEAESEGSEEAESEASEEVAEQDPLAVLKNHVKDTLDAGLFYDDQPSSPPANADVLIWGVSLAANDERTDTVLLKFLRARDFKPEEAMRMLKATVKWRRDFGIDALMETDLGVPELESVVFYRGADREGRPVCYNVYGEFHDKELYETAFGDDEKQQRFLKWRIQLLERHIRDDLDFSSGGICSMVQVTDLKRSPSILGKHGELARQALKLLENNYPDFMAQKVFINVPWWYLSAHKICSPFFSKRTKSKFTFCKTANNLETLFRYIAPEQVPVQFGGLL